MKKKLIICIILLLILVPLINNFHPRNVGKLIQTETLCKNTTKVIITKYDGIHEKGTILITNKTKIQELITYLSKEKVRKFINFGVTNNSFRFDKHYNLEFYGDSISLLDIYDNNYLTINNASSRNITTYSFASNFKSDYIRNLHD